MQRIFLQFAIANCQLLIVNALDSPGGPMAKITRRAFVKCAAITGGIGAVGALVLSSRSKPTGVRIENVTHSYEEHAFRTPLRFARANVNRQTMLTVECTVRTASGNVATG